MADGQVGFHVTASAGNTTLAGAVGRCAADDGRVLPDELREVAP